MTPASSLLDPASNPALYTSTVLTLYVDLPDTPLRASIQDQRLAQRLFETGVPLSLVETALLLGSLRRLCRPSDVRPLPESARAARACRAWSCFPMQDALPPQPMR